MVFNEIRFLWVQNSVCCNAGSAWL
uniref:Uncharacterized protein n=1 Tax=Anguilla anguilla TaxID=7936 RepID=A0A0E9S0H3_ANGAN